MLFAFMHLWLKTCSRGKKEERIDDLTGSLWLMLIPTALCRFCAIQRHTWSTSRYSPSGAFRWGEPTTFVCAGICLIYFITFLFSDCIPDLLYSDSIRCPLTVSVRLWLVLDCVSTILLTLLRSSLSSAVCFHFGLTVYGVNSSGSASGQQLVKYLSRLMKMGCDLWRLICLCFSIFRRWK